MIDITKAKCEGVLNVLKYNSMENATKLIYYYSHPEYMDDSISVATNSKILTAKVILPNYTKDDIKMLKSDLIHHGNNYYSLVLLYNSKDDGGILFSRKPFSYVTIGSIKYFIVDIKKFYEEFEDNQENIYVFFMTILNTILPAADIKKTKEYTDILMLKTYYDYKFSQHYTEVKFKNAVRKLSIAYSKPKTNFIDDIKEKYNCRYFDDSVEE